MFCEECGKELKQGDAFCTNCGAKTKNKVQESKPKQVRKPLDKKTKIIISVITILVIVIGAFIIVGNMLFSSKAVVEKYAKAYLSNDYETVMDLISVEENEFVTKKILKKKYGKDTKDSNDSNISVEKDTLSTDKFIESYTVSYLESGKSSSTQKMTVKVKKSGNKKLLIFDEYEIVDSNPITVSDVTITVPEGSKVSIDGVEVKSKYKEKKSDRYSSSRDDSDIYKIPILTKTNVVVAVKLNNGFVIEKEEETLRDNDNITLSGYYNKVTLNKDTEKKVTNAIKDTVTDVVNGAISKKEASSFKENSKMTDDFIESSDFTTYYEYLISGYEYDKAKEFKVSKVEIDSVTISKSTMSVKAKISYEYSYQDSEKSKENSKNITFEFDITDGDEKIAEFSLYNLYYIF